MSILLTKSPSTVSLDAIGVGGPFTHMSKQDSEALLGLGELVGLQPDRVLVRQYHRAEHFFLLLHGKVRFSIEVEGQTLGVGSSEQAWTPVGWSGFRHPHRYATTVKAARYTELLCFKVEELERFFEERPSAAMAFFESLSEGGHRLLIDARERLLGSLREGTSLSNWSTGRDPTTERTTRRKDRVMPPEALAAGQLRGSEDMVTNAAPDARTLLRRSSFFQDFSDRLVDLLSREASTSYFCRGDVLIEQGGVGADLVLLAEGRTRLEYTDADGRTAVLRTLGKPGQVLSWCTINQEHRSAVTVRATRDGAVLRIPAGALRRIFAVHPKWGVLYARHLLWLIGRHLRAARAHLMSESFDREVLAVENMIEQSRTELSVASPLHKLPHLLRSAVTLGDALAVVDASRTSDGDVESHLAELCHELLAPVRREHRFFTSLQSAFEQVVTAPQTEQPSVLRKRNAESFVRMFSQVPSRVEGLENLPERPGQIFIFNHLRNHDYNTLPNGFQLTLDSHFLSSMILHRHYGDPGVRVVRRSRSAEYGHQAYYDRLGHVSVYTRESDDTSIDKSERVKEFVDTCSAHLRDGTNIVLAPEGTSYSTEESPGPFKAGAFRLAASLQPEPLIVPMAVANFDRRLDRALPAVVIDKPFHISQRVRDPSDPVAMRQFLEGYRSEYRDLVDRARKLSQGD